MNEVCDLSNRHCVPCEGGVPTMTREEAAKAIEARARPFIELVIGNDGRVQLIVPVKPEANVADRALAAAASEWVFEPAAIDGTPVCIRDILTSTVHPW